MQPPALPPSVCTSEDPFDQLCDVAPETGGMGCPLVGAVACGIGSSNTGDDAMRPLCDGIIRRRVTRPPRCPFPMPSSLAPVVRVTLDVPTYFPAWFMNIIYAFMRGRRRASTVCAYAASLSLKRATVVYIVLVDAITPLERRRTCVAELLAAMPDDGSIITLTAQHAVAAVLVPDVYPMCYWPDTVLLAVLEEWRRLNRERCAGDDSLRAALNECIHVIHRYMDSLSRKAAVWRVVPPHATTAIVSWN